MFYSHSLLARKSPLGTVWMAAHLEQRIKKPQIDVIDIPSYADCIMFPEVPIALRLSGHLLLGLVRIYSLKVKYLVQDCNRMLSDIRIIFPSVQVNLPVEADRAPFASVTLPSTFDLSAIQLDDYQSPGPDKHRWTHDQITIQDETTFEEQYVSVSVYEDNWIQSSPDPIISNTGAVTIEEDGVAQFDAEHGDRMTPSADVADGKDPGPSNLNEEGILPPFEGELGDFATPIEHVGDRDQTDSSIHKDPVSDEVPEVVRGAVHNTGSELGDTIIDFDGCHEHFVPSVSKNGNLSPIMEGLSAPGEGSFPSLAGNKGPATTSTDCLDILNTGTSLGQQPEMELQPSPPVNQNRGKKRKRKQFFDESLVLTNAFMKQQLNDTSKLVCKRSKLPCSTLDMWRFHRTQNKRFLHEPFLSGMCAQLKEVFDRKLPPSSRSESASFDASSGNIDAPEKNHAVADVEKESEQPCFDSNVGDTAHDRPPVTSDMDIESDDRPPVTSDMDIESEQFRFDSHVGGTTHDLVQPSPVTEEFTFSISNLSGSSPKKTKGFVTEELPTYRLLASADSVGLELATPLNLVDQSHLDDSNLREPPSIRDSADEHLSFLEASNGSSGYDATEGGNMSDRTRKVAQFLNEHSPDAYTPKDQSACLSLNKILENKTRKQSARMFFETLVLKSLRLIDVQQEEPYADILISRTPALSSIKF